MPEDKRKFGTPFKTRTATPKSILPPEEWVHLLSLLAPLLVLDVTFKIVRIVTQFGMPGPLGFLDLIRSEVLFCLGYATLWVGLFAVFRSGRARLAVFVLFRVLTITLAVLIVVAHFYYQTTGSPFDLSLLGFSVATFAETTAVVPPETGVLHGVLIGALFLYAAFGPAALTRIFFARWRVPARDPGKPRRPVRLTIFAAALAGVLLSTLPGITGASSFSREAVVNMFVFRIQIATEPQINTRLAAEDLPTDTWLTPQRSSGTERRNVVLVFLESTRARSTTPYNPDLKTTPYMDKLAEESLVAENAYAVVPHTSKALVASMCGVAPPLETSMIESEPNAIPGRCLPDLLEDQGYKSAFFQSATGQFERRRDLLGNFGYDEFYPVNYMPTEGFQEVNYFGYEDNVMLGPSRRWLEFNGDEGPFLTSYLTVTPHHDYIVPRRYGKKRFARDELLNRYQNTVRYEDFFLRNLIDQYKQMGEYRDSVFIILGDHGEGFGEHGRYQHDDTIYNEGIKIPLIIHDPRNESLQGKRVEPPVNELDILPTVADLLGYDIEGGTYPGASITSPPKLRTLMTSCYHENRCMASIRGSEKYIYHYGNQPPEFFDLAKDPLERRNVIGQHRKEIRERRRDLLYWESKVEESYEQQLSRQENATGE